MARRDPDRYMQGDDGLIVEKIGSWAVKKLELLTDYVFASGGARQGYERTGTALTERALGHLIANAIGVVRFDQIQEKLGQIWNMVELTRSALVAAEASRSGSWEP